MKQYLLKASGIAAVAVLMSTSVFSQHDRNRSRLGESDEITITKKGNKDTRVVIEVRDGEVTVNGRPLEEYKDGDVIVRRNSRSFYNGNDNTTSNGNTTRIYTPSSPFRGQADAVVIGDRAYLGVTTEKSNEGARITSIGDNTAADKAGLEDGDVITHIDDERINDHEDLSAAIRKRKPHDKVTITYQRDGRERSTGVTLGKTGGSVNAMVAPPKVPVAPRVQSEPFKKLESDGFKFDFDFDNNNFNRAQLFSSRGRLGIRAQDTEDGRGVKVLNVDEGSPADKAGIREGDVIVEFEGKDVNSADQLANAARTVKDQSSMEVRVNRDGRTQTMEIRIPKKLKTTNL